MLHFVRGKLLHSFHWDKRGEGGVTPLVEVGSKREMEWDISRSCREHRKQKHVNGHTTCGAHFECRPNNRGHRIFHAHLLWFMLHCHDLLIAVASRH